MKMKQSSEAFWWSLFSAGGVVSAIFLPALVVITGLILPARDAELGRRSFEQIDRIVSWWPMRGILFVIFFLSFFHAAHRIRHIFMDLGWRHSTTPLSAMCYGGALLGAVAAAWVLLGL